MESTTDRKGFLKYALATVAAGIGVVITPRFAFAVNASCCRVTSGCPICTGTRERYRCRGCPGGDYCACAEQSQVGRCFTIGCP